MTLRGLKQARFPEPLQIKTELRPIAALKPLGRQGRTHSKAQIREIAVSIATFGFLCPVLIDQQGYVLAGMGRLAAAKDLEMTQVPTVVVDHLTAAEKRLYALADNQLATKAGWDTEILAIEFAELKALNLDIDLTVSGFELPAIEAMVFGQHCTDEGEDELPGLPIKPVSRPGDVWILGRHRVGCADALKAVSYRALMAEELAAFACMDMPYNVAIQGNVTSNKNHTEFQMASGEMTAPEFRRFLGTATEAALQQLRPGAVAVCWMDWRSVSPLIEAGLAGGAELLNLLVWDKGAHTGMGSFWRSQHELAPVFKKPGGDHVNNIRLGRHGRNRGNVLRYDGVGGFGAEKARLRELHPTCKSVAMIKDLIIDCTRPGDVVIDGFVGSGTTLIAAERTGRSARVLDLEPRYVDVTVRRWEALTGEETVHAATGRTFRETEHDRAQEVPASAPPTRIRVRVRQLVEG